MSYYSPYRCIHFRIEHPTVPYPLSNCGIRINGKLYFNFVDDYTEQEGFFKDVAASTLSTYEQYQLTMPWPMLDIDGPVWVEGMKAFKEDGSLSTEAGCYLDTVRSTVHEETWIEQIYDGGASERIHIRDDDYEYYALGPVPAEYNGGIVVRGLYEMSQVDTKQFRAGISTGDGVGIINESAPILNTTHLTDEWKYTYGTHCVYEKDAWYHTIGSSAYYKKCTSLVNVLSSGNAQDPYEMEYQWGFHMPQ